MAIGRELGTIAPIILDEVARRDSTWTDKAFARWLGVDNTLVSRWRSGDRNMPVEVLPLLARYIGDPDAVYGDLLARAGCLLVREGDDQIPIDRAVRFMRREMCELLVTVETATDPDGPSGAEMDATERRAVVRDLRELREACRQIEVALGADQ